MLTDQRGNPKPIQWFEWIDASPKKRRPVTAAIGVVIGVAIGILLIVHQRVITGSIACAIAVSLGLVWILSPGLWQRIEQILERGGALLSKVVAWILLTPLFVIVFTAVRVWNRLTRHDPLSRSHNDEASYWILADEHARKLRYASAMFASERVNNRRLGVIPVLLLIGLAVVISEGALRLRGFGAPVLYVADSQMGFYPAPNQIVDRYGGRIEINAFGMRAPQYAPQKRAGSFRILMIGDSTLFGGSYVDQPELYSRRLEQQLRRMTGGRTVEVLPIGVNGWGPFHELGYIQRFGTFDADLAIITLPIGDIYRPLYGLEAMPFLNVRRPPRLALEEVLNHLAWRLRTTEIGVPPVEELRWQGDQGVHAYAGLAQLLSARGSEVMFEVLPSEIAGTTGAVSALENGNVQRLRSAVATAGPFPVAFPVGLFRGSPGRIFHDWVHLDVDGHRWYAEYLRQEVATKSNAWKTWASSTH